jgi:hypothetical protein
MWQNSDEGLVVLSPEGEVLAASPEKLLEKLTAVRFPGQQFTEAFLLTYRGFMTPQRLAQLLKWRLQHVPVLAGQSRNDWSKVVCLNIACRCLTTKNKLLRNRLSLFIVACSTCCGCGSVCIRAISTEIPPPLTLKPPSRCWRLSRQRWPTEFAALWPPDRVRHDQHTPPPCDCKTK